MANVLFAVEQLPAVLVSVVRLALWLVLLAALFIPLERLAFLRRDDIFRKGIWTDLGYYFLNGLVPAFLLGVPLALVAQLVHGLLPSVLTDSVASLPLGVRLVASLLLGDIGYYWAHRWSHEIPFLWRFHAVHHSAEHIDWLVNTRAHPVDLVYGRLCSLTPLLVLGLINPLGGTQSQIPLLVLLVGPLWGFFVHANIRWRFGPLEWLVATPAFHFWHHTNDGPDYVNRNYAALFPMVDILFGSFYLPKDRRSLRYGIDEPMPEGLAAQLLAPFKFK